MNAADFRALMERWAVVMADHRDWLIQRNSVVGDSDLGLTMSDGFRAAADAVNKAPAVDVGKTAYLAGKAMASAVPSTMGTLMASGLMNAGKTFKGVEQCNAKQDVEFFRAYFDGVKSRGKAELGDKTFLDGLYPAIEALDNAINSGIEGRQKLRVLRRRRHGLPLKTQKECSPNMVEWLFAVSSRVNCWIPAQLLPLC